MFLTQIYGTVLGGFINYVMMISIVTGNKEVLADTNGNASWSGATIQSYNTNASTWALAAYLYELGHAYSIVPFGLLIGAGVVAAHRIFAKVGTFQSNKLVSQFDDTSVRSQDRQTFRRRDQLSTIHSVGRVHSV